MLMFKIRSTCSPEFMQIVDAVVKSEVSTLEDKLDNGEIRDNFEAKIIKCND